MPINFNLGAVYNQWANFPAGTQFDITDAITLCCWVKASAWTASAFNDFLSKNNFYLLQTNNNVSPQLQFTVKLTDGWHSITYAVSPSTGIWYFIAGTYDKNAAGNNHIIYTDGVARASIRQTLSIQTDPTSALSIGRCGSATEGDTTRYYHGEVGDARIYNRALSANEILTIYACRGNDGIAQNMVFRSLLNEKNSGATATGAGTVKELSKYLNHGTPSNNPLYTAGVLKYGRFLE